MIDISLTNELEVENRIINGRKANIEDFPHAVAIEGLLGTMLFGIPLGFWFYLCSGSIIQEKFIITARHCVLEYSNYRVVMGTSYVSLLWEDSEFIKQVEEIILHEIEDMALIKLHSQISFTSKMNKIQLSYFTNEDAHNLTNAMIAGWGTPTAASGIRSLWLNYINVTFLQSQSDGYFQVNSTKRFGACTGDSGSGLIVQVEEKQFLHGIVTLGSQECDYTAGPLISTHLAWFDKFIIFSPSRNLNKLSLSNNSRTDTVQFDG